MVYKWSWWLTRGRMYEADAHSNSKDQTKQLPNSTWLTAENGSYEQQDVDPVWPRDGNDNYHRCCDGTKSDTVYQPASCARRDQTGSVRIHAYGRWHRVCPGLGRQVEWQRTNYRLCE